MATAKNPKIQALLKEFDAIVEKIRVTAIQEGEQVYLELPDAYSAIHVVTQEEIERNGEWWPFGYKVGDWISSSSLC